jgi:RNA polymerase sigma-70 factor (ECF subfamily)
VPVALVVLRTPPKETQPAESCLRLTVDGERGVSPDDDEVRAREAVARVLQGDVSAFAEIVQRWQGPLVNLAYRFVRDRGRAEEMAQEAFLRAFRGLGTWRRDSAFSTWLFAVATNLYRSELRRIPPMVPLDEIGEPAVDEGLEGRIETVDRRRIVRRMLHSLPPKYRDAIVLFYFHGADVTATSRSLGVPEGTVKARLARGRDMLRSKLTRVLGVTERKVRNEA